MKLVKQKILPLDDIRVLDVATFVAAPFAAACLAEFGADVIKIERPGIGDDLRRLGTKSEKEDTYWWFNDARNKKSVTLNLSDKRGASLFRNLAKTADVIVENFRPGTMERWGLGFADLLAINPKLIMLRVSGYGQNGPKCGDPSFARIAQAYAGLSYLTGQQNTPPLIAGSTTLADYLAGLYGAFGIMLALRALEKTGVGQYIDVALHDGIFRFLDEIAAVYDKTGYIRERSGTETSNAVPHSHYLCADKKWVAIACTNDKMFARLAQVMDQPKLADKGQFGEKVARINGRDQVNNLVQTWTKTHSRDAVIQKCANGNVPCGPVCSIEDIFNEEQFWARGTLTEVSDPRIGKLTVQGTIPKLSGTPGSIRHLGEKLAAHNSRIYEGELGLTKKEIKALIKAGVI